MKKNEYTTGRSKPVFRALAALLLAACPSLLFGGCVIGNDEFDEARRDRDRFLEESQSMGAANDRLNKEIGAIYNDCDFLASQLAMVSAVSLHNRLTEDIGKPKPTPQPTRPAVRPTRPQPSSGSGSGSGSAQRPSGGSGGGSSQRPSSGSSDSSGSSGSSGGGSSGGGTGGGGAVDWGSLSF